MSLTIRVLELGPVLTNCYLVMDDETKELVVIDPGWDGDVILNEIEEMGGVLKGLWMTHGHFDHLGGVAALADRKDVEICIHPEEKFMYDNQGGALYFGLKIDQGPEPTIWLDDVQVLTIGEYEFEVIHTPGHSPGHVIFHCSKENILFSGDLIFQGSIGRTDLPGGSYDQIISSIKESVLTLPEDTRILSGHGPETSVAKEKVHNPFLR